MRHALAVLNADLVLDNYKYVMRITGDNDEGKRELDNFINPEERFPVIATTSKLLTTGVDAQTCKLIALDANIASMTDFKQIIGRGTSIRSEYRSLDDFLARWNAADRKQAIIEEFAVKGIVREDLLEETKRDYFEKYGEKARAVLRALVERYAEGGVEEIEELSALKLEPLCGMGSVQEILAAFGGREAYLTAVRELENRIYEAA